MKCEDINELLVAFLDKEVTPEERKQIEAHLSICEKCQKEMRLLASTREGLGQALGAKAAEVEPSPQMWDRVRQRITLKPPLWSRISGILDSPARRVIVPVVLVLVAVGALWWSGVLPRLVGFEAPTPPAITFAPGPSGSASYVSGFQNMGELCNSSDAIVVGTVDRVIEVVPDEYGHGILYDATSAFSVETVLKGKIGKEIILTKMALAGPDGWVEGMAEDPPFEAGEKWVLFLSADMSYNNLGPWGRYKIINGKVYSMNRLVADTNAYGEGELDFNGVDLSEFIACVNETLDSVVLTFTDSRIGWAIASAVRFDAGGSQEVNVNLSTGKYGPGNLAYTLKRVESKDSAVEMPMPDGLDVTIEPAQFTASPRNMYQSTLKIQTVSDLPPGTYWIRVEYELGQLIYGHRVIMININPLENANTD